jgi:hypothetical protein
MSTTTFLFYLARSVTAPTADLNETAMESGVARVVCVCVYVCTGTRRWHMGVAISGVWFGWLAPLPVYFRTERDSDNGETSRRISIEAAPGARACTAERRRGRLVGGGGSTSHTTHDTPGRRPAVLPLAGYVCRVCVCSGMYWMSYKMRASSRLSPLASRLS